MQIADNSDNFQQQILTELRQLNDHLEKLEYKFDTYQKASDQVVRLATTIIIAAASVVILSPVLQAVAPVISAFVENATRS